MEKHKTAIQIRFKDIDAFGHVNNANHISYIEQARISYLNDVLGSEIDWVKTGIILAKTTIEYKIPIRLTDVIMVYTWCSKMGSKSFDLTYSIVKMKEGKETEIAGAVTVMVCFNYSKKETIPVPDKWKENLEVIV